MGRASYTGVLCFLVAAGCAGCGDDVNKPLHLGAKEYRSLVSAFYSGVTALDVDDKDRARRELTRATQIADREPAPWLDLAVLSYRTQDAARAQNYLSRARERLGPQGAPAAVSRVELLTGLMAADKGDLSGALTHLRRTVQLEPDNLHFLYALYSKLDLDPSGATNPEKQQCLGSILERQPYNLFALVESLRLAIHDKDEALVRKRMDVVRTRVSSWPKSSQDQFRDLDKSINSHAPDAERNAVFLRNVLKEVPEFTRSMAVLTNPLAAVGEPLEQFVRLPAPVRTAAPPDSSLSFTPAALPGGDWSVFLPPTAGKTMLTADGKSVRLEGAPPTTVPTPVTLPSPGAAPDGVLAIDWNNDMKTDLLLAGPAGLRFYQQEDPSHWPDVAAKTHLPAEILNGSYTAAWALDVELEGDLDVVLGRASGPPVVLRNNGDGTWKPVQPFPGVAGIRSLVWMDLDRDGTPDVAMVDGAGKLVVFLNRRAGKYERIPGPAGLGPILAAAISGADDQGTLGLGLLQADGTILRAALRENGTWDRSTLAIWQKPPADGTARLFFADLDNNGAADILVSGSGGSQVWLGASGAAYQPLSQPIPARVLSIGDTDGDGRLDLAGATLEKSAARLINHGTAAYRWQEIRPHAVKAVGDQRINSFGIGGVMELRAGLLLEKQPILSPVVHFGLGANQEMNLVRITWPSGSAQAEFDYKRNLSVAAEQRLHGSCPWLYAYDGKQIQFVGDVLFNSPLGLRINGQDTAGVAQTRDWVRIRGDQLQPHDGFYDLRLTGELWETDIFDYLSLMTVDHPAGTEVYLDERFSIPPPELRVRVTEPAKPFARVTDDHGTDVADMVKVRDGRYLDTFEVGRYQGIARDHWVEVELPADAPADRPLYLLANGWIHPTDSSINVAVSQGSQEKPRPLSLEVPDGRGGWRTAKAGLGFPAGKNKTVIIDLAGVFPGTAGPRKVRLRTNLEIYWDQLSWTAPRPDVKPLQREIRPDVAELRYRGFSYVHQAGPSSPETPDYNHLQTTRQMWPDLEGYYTRFGDVRELLQAADDRYVLLNAGDEIALRFPEQPAPPAGWVRDYVFVSDGWDKDGNFNTSFSRTLLPLPSHARPEYNTPPGRLEEDPVYRQHADDWKKYHTRYVTTDQFRRGLWTAAP